MKNASRFAAIVLSVLMLSACGGGDVRHAAVLAWEPSQLYTDQEIMDAIRVAESYFAKEFDGCTLEEIGYVGDGSAGAFQEWAAQYGADEAIVLTSSFTTGPSGGDGSLTPNATYEDWQWILVRSGGGSWRHADHGY